MENGAQGLAISGGAAASTAERVTTLGKVFSAALVFLLDKCIIHVGAQWALVL